MSRRRRKVLVVMHQDRSDPGRVGRYLRARGYVIDGRKPSVGEPLPQAMDDYVGAVVLGGPASANDDHLAFMRTELAWLEKTLKEDKPVLGVCLGAQMMARVLGASVHRHVQEKWEVGYYRILPTEEGRWLMPGPMWVYQWHGEWFEMPEGAEALARCADGSVQAMRWGASYGLQFHPEVHFSMMMRWLKHGRERLTKKGARPAWMHITDRVRYDGKVRRWLDKRLLSAFAANMEEKT